MSCQSTSFQASTNFAASTNFQASTNFHASTCHVPTLQSATATINATAVGHVRYYPYDAEPHYHFEATIQIGRATNAGKTTYRSAYWNWDISSILDAVSIESVTLEYSLTSSNEPGTLFYNVLPFDPSQQTAQALYDAIEYNEDYDPCDLSGSQLLEYMLPDFVTAVNANQTYFALGLQHINNSTSTILDNSLSVNRLIVEYTHYD